ncbi:MAG TPA: hypothetical protein VGK58_11730, partial [Lacipirellulaceae bacterium]
VLPKNSGPNVAPEPPPLRRKGDEAKIFPSHLPTRPVGAWFEEVSPRRQEPTGWTPHHAPIGNLWLKLVELPFF